MNEALTGRFQFTWPSASIECDSLLVSLLKDASNRRKSDRELSPPPLTFPSLSFPLQNFHLAPKESEIEREPEESTRRSDWTQGYLSIRKDSWIRRKFSPEESLRLQYPQGFSEMLKSLSQLEYWSCNKLPRSFGTLLSSLSFSLRDSLCVRFSEICLFGGGMESTG